MRIALSDRRSAGDGASRPRQAVHDRDMTMPGRGAYLCLSEDPQVPAAACVALATRRGAIARALRSAVLLDPKLVESVNKVAQPTAGRLAETGIRAEGACHPASVGPLAISKS
jgi:predicted RNA-binding protein YlxR (DUF448 family)